MTSQNLTMSNLLSVNETIVYREHPHDKQKYVYKREEMIFIHVRLTRFFLSLIAGPSLRSRLQSQLEALSLVGLM